MQGGCAFSLKTDDPICSFDLRSGDLSGSFWGKLDSSVKFR
uniref:Uncharacterized protein n=1 Tax=Nelumbo nucifera TaxID=4432 RepID=A0A822YBD4_NELNU|nr:TPA_asm: hypothetical protein HUJ06_031215 [Nelumbo nucifera]